MRSSTRIGWSSIPNFDLLPGRFASAYADSICIAFDPKNEMNIQSFVRFVLSNVKLWLFRILETSIVHFYFTVFEATNFETVYVSSLWHYSIHLGPSIVTWRSHPLIIFSQNLRFLFFFFILIRKICYDIFAENSSMKGMDPRDTERFNRLGCLLHR